MSQINYKKYIHDYAGDGFGGVKKIIFFEEAWRRYSEELKTWLQDIVVPRKDKTIQVEVLYGYPQMPSALRSATSQQEKPDVNREFSQKLVDLREDRTKIPIIGYYISTITYDQSRELPGEIFYRGKYTDDSKKNIVMMNKEIPFILQYTLSVWTRQKSDMYYIHQQILSRFNPNVVFFIDNQEIPVRLDSIVDTSSLESAGGAYQLIRNDIVITMDAWMKRNAVTVRTIQREKVVYSEKVVTPAGIQVGPSIVNFLNVSEDFAVVSGGGAEFLAPLTSPTLYPLVAGDQTINLIWSSVSNATGYLIKYGTFPAVYNTTIDAGQTNSYQLTGLINGTTYYVVVAAYKYGVSAMANSNEQIATPHTPTPPVPTWPYNLLIHGDDFPVVDSSSSPKIVTNNNVVVNNGSMYFNGVDGYLQVASSPEFTFGSNDWTVACWVNFDDLNKYMYPFDLVTVVPFSLANDAIHLYRYPFDGRYLQCELRINNGVVAVCTVSVDPFILNVWHHIAVIRNGDTLTIFVDGEVKATTSGASAANFTQPFIPLIGSTWSDAFFEGYIREVTIVNGMAIPPSLLLIHGET